MKTSENIVILLKYVSFGAHKKTALSCNTIFVCKL